MNGSEAATFLAGTGFFEGFTAIALIGLFGTAIKWLWDKVNARIDKRTAELDARERAFDDKRDGEIEVLKAEVKRLADGYDQLTDVVSRQRTAIHLLVAKILKEEPDAPELKLVEHLLGHEFPKPARPSVI